VLLRSERGREGVSGSEMEGAVKSGCEMERVVSSGSEMEGVLRSGSERERVLRSEREGDLRSEREEEPQSQSILGGYLGDFVFNDFFSPSSKFIICLNLNFPTRCQHTFNYYTINTYV